MTMTVMVHLRSVDILRTLTGHRVEGNGDLQRDIAEAGSIEDYLDAHPIYKHLGLTHRETAIICARSEFMDDALDAPRMVADDQNLIVQELDPETLEAVPWSDAEVTLC